MAPEGRAEAAQKGQDMIDSCYQDVGNLLRAELAGLYDLDSAELDAMASFDELLALVYEDTPQKLWPLAALSLEAHLQKLIEDGRITRAGAQISSTS